jgi:hypothetical protein
MEGIRTMSLIGLVVCCSIGSLAQIPYDYKWAITQFSLPIRFEDSNIKQDTPFYFGNRFLYTGSPMSSIYIDSTLYATNSVDIVSEFYDTIRGVEAMLDEDFRLRYKYGAPADNYTLLLPKRDNEFYIINRSSTGASLDPNGNMIIDATYYSVIDAQKKEVKSAKHVLNRTMVTPNFLTATRHANGRDFWVVEKAWQGNTYYIYRTTPDTILLEHVQSIGDSARIDDVYGSGGFSPDGSLMGVACISQITQYFDFDRCTGRLSNPRRLQVPAMDFNGVIYPNIKGQYGIGFSKNSRYAYVNAPNTIFQYDLLAGDSLAVKQSEQLIIFFDTTLTRAYNTSTPFFYSRHTPNGKLIYAGFNLLPYAYCTINFPDSAGLACGFDTFDLAHSSLGNQCLTNVPQYSLGKIVGSGCDTAFTTGVSELGGSIGFELYPNPASAMIRVKVEQAGEVVVYDILGKEALRTDVDEGEQTIAIGHLSGGIYQAVLLSGSQRAVRRLVVW